MKTKEFREYMKNYEQGIETHEDNFAILSDFVILNDIVTFHHIDSIKLVGEVLWIGRHNINLHNVTKLYIAKVESYIDE